ncbi:LacI family DNA-binding transcriptional regulator [Pleomorphomonas sp. NRK KF1]|uniref:LacI family DNA-binding transcriptional regulator n=1 Tax=Pleomorphomonas sp. NRK KF1 TaxID=2943000 RepID=UPI0020448F05|nr:substrate-binding domain-containing protein [Pleomorphomonas sp. NRK KF1]MCM5555342.1 substrate-binding domain-containing protein [Pleomorphomonas sp. NRK KF1]
MTMTLKEFSKTIGMSQTTVSRALGGYPEVNEATRRKIREAAEQYNYHPNSRATGLATGRSMMIGHILATRTRHEMVNPIFGDFVASASKTYAEYGYDMMFTRVEDGNEEASYLKLKARQVLDGLVVQGPTVKDAHIPILKKIGIPFVVHGRSSELTESYSWVDVNNRAAFKRATQFLIDLGHRRIGLINGLEHMDYAFRRREGYTEALLESGIEVDPALMSCDEMTEAFGYQRAQQMLQTDAPPTAFVVSSLISAFGVRRAAEQRGLVLGKDFSVVCHDDDLSYFENGRDVPIFTSTRSSVREAGRLLAELLIEKISNPKMKDRHILLEAALVVGTSTGPAPSAG